MNNFRKWSGSENIVRPGTFAVNMVLLAIKGQLAAKLGRP